MLFVQTAPPARAQAPERIAIWRIDPLGGLSSEIVARLESLLTQELGRLSGEIVPSIKTQQEQRKHRSLRSCEGADLCLAAIGRSLKVGIIISGTLASLGQDYVVTLKAVEAATGRSIRRISETLSGEREQLIEAVRVAAYRLLKPEQLRGSLQVLVNIPGATIFLDGQKVGVSPLRTALSNLEVREHSLRITHPEFVDFIRKVNVRFQKTSLVRVTLNRPKADPSRPTDGSHLPPAVRNKPTPWYSSWWFWTVVGVVAVSAGAATGYFLPRLPYNPKSCDGCACGGCLP
ncbi:MAG: PEGA domain-containing protein [Polyangia bacterium]|nr:PEGA domain-containing protein [Polyangia bacterium]